jgi:hypothetical protein
MYSMDAVLNLARRAVVGFDLLYCFEPINAYGTAAKINYLIYDTIHHCWQVNIIAFCPFEEGLDWTNEVAVGGGCAHHPEGLWGKQSINHPGLDRIPRDANQWNDYVARTGPWPNLDTNRRFGLYCAAPNS